MNDSLGTGQCSSGKPRLLVSWGCCLTHKNLPNIVPDKIKPFMPTAQIASSRPAPEPIFGCLAAPFVLLRDQCQRGVLVPWVGAIGLTHWCILDIYFTSLFFFHLNCWSKCWNTYITITTSGCIFLVSQEVQWLCWSGESGRPATAGANWISGLIRQALLGPQSVNCSDPKPQRFINVTKVTRLFILFLILLNYLVVFVSGWIHLRVMLMCSH